MTIDKFIKDQGFKDYGQNADWAVSVYKIHKESYVLFECENNQYFLTFMPKMYREDGHERNFIMEDLATFDNNNLSGLLETLKRY